jgi:undecaprenyl-diphosphatase
MITYFQAAVLGLFQGFSELFPVSSLGHSVILPSLLGWNLSQGQPFFLTFLVATHLATAIVLIGFFFKDWIAILKGLGRSLAQREIREDDTYAHLGWLLVIGTVPAGVIGVLLQEPLASLFASARIAAFFLILNGGLLYGAELLRRKATVAASKEAPDRRLTGTLSYAKSFAIGAAQSIALIPGFSRSGASMAGGLLVGLSNEDAARFSFLLATPIIAAAALLKLPALFSPENRSLVGPAVLGALCAGVTAYFSVRFLLRFFQSNRLTPFAVYCVVAGIGSLASLCTVR